MRPRFGKANWCGAVQKILATISALPRPRVFESADHSAADRAFEPEQRTSERHVLCGKVGRRVALSEFPTFIYARVRELPATTF